MKDLLFETKFKRSRIVQGLMVSTIIFLLLVGILMGVLIGAALIISMFDFNVREIGDHCLMVIFMIIFLVIIPLSTFQFSRLIIQQQMRIHRTFVEMSHSPSIWIWKRDWARLELKDYPYFIATRNNLSLVDKESQYAEILIYRSSKYNRTRIEKAGKVLEDLGLQRVTMEKWVEMRKKKISEM